MKMFLFFQFSFFIFITIISNTASAAVALNEFMPDPVDSCRDCTEWVEFFANGTPQNLTIDAGGKNTSFSINGPGYFVITGNKTEFLKLWKTEPGAVIEGGMSLNNGGDCVHLYDESGLADSFCYNSSRSNYSWAECAGEWAETANATPGMPNDCSGEENHEGNLSILNWSFYPDEATAGDLINFSFVIENNKSSGISASVSIIIAALNLDISCGDYAIRNMTIMTAECLWIVPHDLETGGVVSFEIYPEVLFNGSAVKGETKIIKLEGAADFGEPSIEASNPEKASRFGDFALAVAEFYAGGEERPLRIVAYIYKPYWVSMDLDGRTIHTGLNETATALKIANPRLGENVTLYLPILIKGNCDGEYPEGNYTGRVRAYLDGTDEIVAQDTFDIIISGSNSIFCKDCPACKKTVCKCPACSSCGSGAVSGGARNSSQEDSNRFIHMISYSGNAAQGATIVTNVSIHSPAGQAGNFTVYSYVFNGTACVSTGFDGRSWKNTWTANQKTVRVPAGSSINLSLENIIENGTPPGLYSLRVRLKYGERQEDVTREIYIERAQEPGPEIEESPEMNVTEPVNFEAEIPVSGMAVKEDSGILGFFSDVYVGMSSWFSSVFKF